MVDNLCIIRGIVVAERVNFMKTRISDKYSRSIGYPTYSEYCEKLFYETYVVFRFFYKTLVLYAWCVMNIGNRNEFDPALCVTLGW